MFNFIHCIALQNLNRPCQKERPYITHQTIPSVFERMTTAAAQIALFTKKAKCMVPENSLIQSNITTPRNVTFHFPLHHHQDPHDMTLEVIVIVIHINGACFRFLPSPLLNGNKVTFLWLIFRVFRFYDWSGLVIIRLFFKEDKFKFECLSNLFLNTIFLGHICTILF